jgi:integrase/recombinase XerD
MPIDFETFLTERRYLKGISERTIDYYRDCFRHFGDNSTPNNEDLKRFVIGMRERGFKETTCNAYIRGLNAYLRWAGTELTIPKLKEPKLVLPTYADGDLQRLIEWKPHGWYQRRLHLLVLSLIDSGTRINELLTLRWRQVDFDNLLVTIDGKGSKQRIIPFSIELRRHLYRWKQENPHELVFCTRQGGRLTHRNCMRDIVALCHKLKVRVPERSLHAFRHTFALNYLRRGGSVFHLQKVLGHATLEMTRRYVNLTTDDLQREHEHVSMLSRGFADRRKG